MDWRSLQIWYLRSGYIPEKDIRILSEFSRYQYKLVNIRSYEKNCFQNALTVGNCKLDLVFTDVFGKSASSIVNTILSDEPYTSEDILSKVHEKCNSFAEDILSAIEVSDLNHFKKKELESFRSIWNMLILFLTGSTSYWFDGSSLWRLYSASDDNSMCQQKICHYHHFWIWHRCVSMVKCS